MFGVTGQAISQVLSGKNSPSHTLAKAVAKARGYKSPEDLYLSGGTTSVAPPQKRKHWETAATSSYSQVGSDDEPFDPETPDDDDTWEPFAAIPVQFNGTLGVVWYWKRER
jgi:transcriptional regulator with XRE-family HTH domain